MLKRLLRRWVVLALIWVAGRTARTERINWHILERLHRDGTPYILALWHTNILSAIYYLGCFRLPVLISRSRDGDDINWIAERFGFEGLRGSASQGGAVALRQALRVLAQGRPVLITPDGPRGPRYELKPGLVGLARKRGVPIVPVFFSALRRWEFRSWDRTKLPKPFARTVVLVGDPLWLQGDATPEEVQTQQVQDTLRTLARHAEAYTGADQRFPDEALAPAAAPPPAQTPGTA